MLLLAEKVLGELVAALLKLLLGSELDNLLADLSDVFCRSLALAGDRFALCLAVHGRRRRLGSRTLKLVDALHVVKEVVATGEAMSRHSTLAILKVTEVGPSTVTVHAVCLTLMAEQACSGRELNADASLLVAAEWLQVRVDVLVIVALQRCRLVGAARLALLRAVVLAILVRSLLVEDVAASDLGALLLELSLGRVSRRLDILVAIQRLWRKRGRSALFCVIPACCQY